MYIVAFERAIKDSRNRKSNGELVNPGEKPDSNFVVTGVCDNFADCLIRRKTLTDLVFYYNGDIVDRDNWLWEFEKTGDSYANRMRAAGVKLDKLTLDNVKSNLRYICLR